MKRWLVRVVLALTIFEVAYLAVVNTALNLPATQDYLNHHDPERPRLQWDRAWSWYPFRVQVTGFSGNFQSWSAQWQISTPDVSASIAVIPLLWKTVEFYDMNGGNIDLRVRPRVEPDRDDAHVHQYYPTIEGRDPNLAVGTKPTQSPGWRIVFDIADIDGQNNVWIGGTKATVSGNLAATIIHQGRHGSLEVKDGDADLALTSLSVNGQQVSQKGSIKTTLDFASFIPYENRGLKMLSFMSLDADIDLPVDGLEFLNSYLNRFSGLSLSGSGGLRGRIVFDKGDLIAGSDLEISADGLKVSQPPFIVDGTGLAVISVTASAPKTLTAAFQFDDLSALDSTDKAALLEGKGLKIVVDRSAYVLPGGNEAGPKRVSLDIPEMMIPDLTAYQGFLPDKWWLALLGGSGSIAGKADLSAGNLHANLMIRSEDANVKFKDDSFETDLVFVLKASGEAAKDTAEVNISGSTLDLDDSRIKLRDGDTTNSWQASLMVSTGTADFDLPKPSETGQAGFWRLAKNRNIKSLLSTVDGQVNADLAIASLDWANSLIDNPYSLAFDGGAKIGADLSIRSGYLDKGSKLAMQPQKFSLKILDYIAEGNGGFDLTVTKGGEEPDLNVTANLSGASFRRQNETHAVISDMILALNASTTGVSLLEDGQITAVDLSIPSAKVTDMRAYNAYFPKGSPIRILGGTADLKTKIDIQKSTTTGFVKLKTSRVDASLDGQRISGTAGVDVKIGGGSAKDQSFDITGSTLTLDGVRISGQSPGPDWNTRIDFGKSRVVWEPKRASLDASASIRMTDTRPLIEIFKAYRKGNEWLDRILTLKDVHGNITVKVEPHEFVVPHALAKSDTIEIGAKGLVREMNRQGIFYAKYGPLAAILEFENGKRHFGLINATKKFEEYKPGGKLPGMSEKRSTEKKSGPFSVFRRE